MLGDFGRYGKNRPERGSVSIPMVISGPGIKQSAVSGEFFELQDLAATLLDLCDLDIPDSFESLSFKPFLTGIDEQGPRIWAYSALNDWKMVMEGSYKAMFFDGEKPQLYDCENDPWEMKDIADEHPEIVNRLESRLV